jgi:phage baseplate assembly protein W
MDGSTTMSKAIALPFSFDGNGAVNNTQDPKKILQDRIVLVVMTYLSERVNRPNFGSNIKAVSFENTTEATQLIKQEVAVVFSKWLPYLNLIDAVPKVDPVDNILSISITYNYGINSNPETVSVKTAIISRSGDVITEVSNG